MAEDVPVSQGTFSCMGQRDRNEPPPIPLPAGAVDFVSLNLSVWLLLWGGVSNLVERRKLAARLRHVLRFCGMYLVSFMLLAILSSPFWIAFLIWWTWG
jgi:hypothetical protein